MNPLAYPVRLPADALLNDASERERYARRLMTTWEEVAVTLEVGLAMGVVSSLDVRDALDANDAGDSRIVSSLAERVMTGITASLDARVGGVSDECSGDLLVSVSSDGYWSEGPAVVVECYVEMAATMPVLSMRRRVARICIDAVVRMCETFGVDLGRYWGVPEVPWYLEERMTCFDELSPDLRNDAEALHAQCLREDSCTSWILDEAAHSVESAELVLAMMNEYSEYLAQMRALWDWQVSQPKLGLEDLRSEAQALASALGDSRDGLWSAWVVSVCDALRGHSGIPLVGIESMSEGSVSLGLLMRIDFGAPWDEELGQDEQNLVMEAGELALLVLPVEDNASSAAAVARGLADLADLVRLLLSAPKGG